MHGQNHIKSVDNPCTEAFRE